MKTAPAPTEKACKTCGEVKPPAEFSAIKNRVGRVYLMGECKPCRVERERRRRERKPQPPRRERPAKGAGWALRSHRRLILVGISDERSKRCSGCGDWKPAPEFQSRVRHRDGRDYLCRPCRAARDVPYRARRNELRRLSHLRDRFGLTADQYGAMLAEQGGGCAICGEPCRTGKSLAVDHDHATGAVRGLLCSSCNTGIGFFGDDTGRLERAIEYIHRAKRRGGSAGLAPAGI